MMKTTLCFALLLIAICEGGRRGGSHGSHMSNMRGRSRGHAGHHGICRINANGVTGEIHLMHMRGESQTSVRVVLNGAEASSSGYHVMIHTYGDCSNPGPGFGSNSMLATVPASSSGTFDEAVSTDVMVFGRPHTSIVGRSLMIHMGTAHGSHGSHGGQIACCVVGVAEMPTDM